MRARRREGSVLRDGLSVHMGGLLEENSCPFPPAFYHTKIRSDETPSWKYIETLPKCWVIDSGHEELSQAVPYHKELLGSI